MTYKAFCLRACQAILLVTLLFLVVGCGGGSEDPILPRIALMGDAANRPALEAALGEPVGSDPTTAKYVIIWFHYAGQSDIKDAQYGQLLAYRAQGKCAAMEAFTGWPTPAQELADVIQRAKRLLVECT